MHRHSKSARLNSSSGQANRGLRLLALAACVAGLAGCANTSQKSTAYTSEIDPYETEWVATADDPIGMLVVQKFKRDRQRNHSEVSSDNAMVSEALNYLGIRYRFGEMCIRDRLHLLRAGVDGRALAARARYRPLPNARIPQFDFTEEPIP